MKELEDLSGLAMFVRIVEDGSLSAAGRSLDLPKATVSRNLTLLEKRLGTALLIRSTRALSLTDAGRRLFERMQPVVQAAREAAADVAVDHAAPSGLLRVAAPVAYGQARIVPRLMALMERYPAVRIDLHLDDSRVNMVGEGYDLAIRMGTIQDSDLVCRKLADIPMVVVAAPRLVQREGTPEQPEDLQRYHAVVTRPDMVHWQVGGKKLRMAWRISTGNMLITRDAARAGLGVALMPEFLVQEDLSRGTLVRLLSGCAVPATVSTLLYAKSNASSVVLRAVLDALLAPEA